MRLRIPWPLALSCLLLLAVSSRGHAADASFQIVESVPQATIYGQPGVPRTQAVWLDMISHARHRIDIAAFYIAHAPGKALSPVLDALVARARAGVSVRVLLDHSFLHEDTAGLAVLKGVPNITVRVLPVDTLTGGVLHAKFMIVDDDQVFVGSQNWDWRALDQIHEIGARIRQPRFARTFGAVFDFQWRLAAERNLPKARARAVGPADFAPVTSSDPVILHSGNGEKVQAYPAFSPPSLTPDWVSHEQAALVGLIKAARHHLRIQVMTLSAIKHYGPHGYWERLDGALRDAAARGVEVQIIVADWALSEPMQAYLKSLAVLPRIEVRFSHLPPAPSGYIPYARVEHCKYAVADDRAIYIGTGNWTWSYFHTTVDASVFVHGHGPAMTLTQIFQRDWNGPYVTTLDPGRRYAPPRHN